jgi:CBS domain-containing protein
MMAVRASIEADRTTTAADEVRRRPVGCPVSAATEVGRQLVNLLGKQARYNLEVAAALGRAVSWEAIARAQGEFARAAIEQWGRVGSDASGRLTQRCGAPRHPRSHLIRDIMKHRRPVVAQSDETVLAAAARMAGDACGSILVCDGERLCGIFTKGDLATRVVGRGLEPAKVRLAEAMTRDPNRIESTATAQEALRRMHGLALRRLPVVEDGRALGMISLRDLPLETVAGMLPELEQRRTLAERMW